MIIEGDFIIFGEGNYNTLGVLYQLAEIGIDPLLVIIGKTKDSKKGNIIGYSKYARRIHEVATEKDGLNWILRNKDNFLKGTIIYPTSDVTEKLLDENFNALKEVFKFPTVGIEGGVSRLMNKQLQTQLANDAGIRVINSQFTNADKIDFDKIKYPCFIKTINSTEGSKGDMKICRNELELKNTLSKKTYGKNYIIQDYILNEKDLLFLGVVFGSGEIWLPAVVVKPGVSFRGEYSHAFITTDIKKYLPEFEAVKAFIKSLRYYGPFSIEFAHEKGKNYFLEINLRNDGTSHYPMNMGINLVKAYIDNKSENHLEIEMEYEMIDETSDLRRVLYRELSLKRWLRSFRKAGSYRFYRKGDYGLILPLFRMFLSRTIRKILF